MSTPAPVTVDAREREIYNYLRSLEDQVAGATARAIYESVRADLGDTVTEQAYRKVLRRLVAAGRIEHVERPDADRYVLAPHLHAGNALTLDDVRELVDDLAPSEAIARVVEAREYYTSHRRTVLRRAALALMDADPRDLVERWLLHQVEQLAADLALLGQDDLRDRNLESRVASQVRTLNQVAYRYLGLTRAAISTPAALTRVDEHSVSVDLDALRVELARRVFGASAIRRVDSADLLVETPWQRISVAGTDGATHASLMQLTAPSAFSDDGSEAVTFNNSTAYVHPSAAMGARNRSTYYSVPMSKSAIDDRENKGMVMAKFMFPFLSDSEYEHMAKAATDVIQWRTDLNVFSGTARALDTGDLLPRPLVHFRDGTLTLQEREWGHYRRANEYGEMVREGVLLSRRILERILGTEGQRPVFAGAVKSTQTRFFSGLLNWFIASGSASELTPAIDPGWDATRAAHISDHEAMSLLLSSLDALPRGSFHVTFVAMRTFGSTTEFEKLPTSDDPAEWVDIFRRKQAAEQNAYDTGADGEPGLLSTVASLEDEDFVWMCRNADYFSFFVGHTAGDPPPTIPRYEFMDCSRRMDPAQVAVLVEDNVSRIVTALHLTGLSSERRGGILSARPITQIVPYVVHEAREKTRDIGQRLEGELRDVVVSNVRRLRGSPVRSSEVRFQPQSVRRFIERYAASLGGADDPRNR